MQKNDILIVYGENYCEMAYDLCDAAGLAQLIGAPHKKIGLKPNLVLASPAQKGATTHPQVVEGVIIYLKEHGFSDISIIEGAWVGARTQQAFSVCGMQSLAKKQGVKLVDTQKDSFKTHECAGMSIDICDAALAVDFMINMPVMKGHCQTGITCALKNNKGVIPDAEKRRFHSLGLHKPIAHLNVVAKNDFILVDGICGDLDFEEGGNPVVANRLFAARDAVLCDAFAAQQLGYDESEIAYIGMAQALSVGSADVKSANIRRLNGAEHAGTAPKPSGKVRIYAKYLKEDSACSACYAAGIRALSHMDMRILEKLKGPICVGQGYKGSAGKLGIGRCTAGFEHSAAGCPPAAKDIADMLTAHAAK